ncbi:unnamed protein product [Aureobasidium pullulans]|nr:unnamed protein product [Aureobasidium pullulans]
MQFTLRHCFICIRQVQVLETVDSDLSVLLAQSIQNTQSTRHISRPIAIMSGANSSSFDNDGDSLMQSGNSSPKPSTPNSQIRSIAISDLSPPDSQGVPHPPAETMPTVAPSASGANMNGKRPISSIDHSQELQGGVSLSAAIPTDAQDDCSRAWDALVDKNRSIGSMSLARLWTRELLD